MPLYSQHDPAYDRTPLGGQTIHAVGCFIVSLANLYQRHPLDLLKIPGAVTADGLVVPPVIAVACGGQSLGEQQDTGELKGWQIAQTDHFASLGYPTHFFCYNPETKEQIDPLKFPAVVAPLSYHIVELRGFTNVILDTSVQFSDVPADAPYKEDLKLCVDKGLIAKAPQFHPDAPLTRAQLVTVFARFIRQQKVGQ